MDPLIESYCIDTFTDDLVGDIFLSFEILNNYDYPELDLDFIRVIMEDTSIDATDMQDKFINLVHAKLDEVLSSHTVILNERASIEDKCKFLEALYLVQDLIDYSNLIYLLESDLEPDEKLAEVIAQLTDLSIPTIISLIEHYDEEILKTLQDYIYRKMALIPPPIPDPIIKKMAVNIFKLETFIKTKTLGGTIIDAGGLINQSFIEYIPQFVKLATEYNTIQYTYHLLSVLLITKDGYLNPINVFRNHSHMLLHDLHRIQQVDSLLIKTIDQFETYKHSTEVINNGSTKFI